MNKSNYSFAYIHEPKGIVGLRSISKMVTQSEINRAGGMLSSGTVKVPNLAMVKMTKK